MFLIEILFFGLLFILIIIFLKLVSINKNLVNDYTDYKEQVKNDEDLVRKNNKKIDKIEKEIRNLENKLK